MHLGGPPNLIFVFPLDVGIPIEVKGAPFVEIAQTLGDRVMLRLPTRGAPWATRFSEGNYPVAYRHKLLCDSMRYSYHKNVKRTILGSLRQSQK